MTQGTQRLDGAVLGAFLLMVVIAGGNAVAVRYTSCEACELDPFWAAATRFTAATVLFAIIMRVLHVAVPRGRALLGAILYGVLTFGIGFGFIYSGLERASAGRGGVLLAMGPLLTFLAAVAHRQEAFRMDGLIGGVLAVAGSAVILDEGIGTGIPLSSLLFILAGVVAWAEVAIIVKAYPPVHPAAMNAVGMAAGTLVLLVLTFIRGEELAVPAEARTWLAQTYLVFLGSVVVFGLYIFVLRRWTASAVSYEFVLLPIVGVILASWLQDEQITRSFILGSLLVLSGVYFGALRKPRARPAPRVIDPLEQPAD